MGFGHISSGATFFMGNHPGDNNSGDLLQGELCLEAIFLGDNFPGAIIV